jgi:hypothetical protein
MRCFVETDHPFAPANPAPRCLPGGATLAVLNIRENLKRSMQHVQNIDDNLARRRMQRQAVVSCDLLPLDWKPRYGLPVLDWGTGGTIDCRLPPHCDDCQRDVADCACSYRSDPLFVLLDYFLSCDL